VCGTLKHSHWTSKDPIRVGSMFPDGTEIFIEGKKLEVPAKWNGFARDDQLEKWKEHGWKEGFLKVDSFTEKDHEFEVPAGKVIKVVALNKSPRPINIVTTEATKEQKKVHHRWPMFIDKE